jgi:putative Mg2+ transporter-C (MgtC) family protein
VLRRRWCRAIGFLGAGSILLRGNVVRGLTTAASIWAVAGIGLAIGGGLYFAGIASTLVILVILAGVKPLEDIYRARNQSCNLEIKAEHGILTPELLKKTLHIRNGQLKRFMVQPSSKRGIDDLHVALARVSPKDVHNFMEKLEGLQAVRGVKRQK